MMRRLLRNTSTLLIGNVGGAALSFLLSILIGRVLGESGIGIYGVVMAWVFPARLLAEFGLGTLITRDVARHVHAGPDYLHATTAARLLLGGGLTLLLWLGAPVLSDDPLVVLGLRVSAPLVLIEPFFGAFTAIFRAEGVMWPISWLSIGMLVAQVGGTALVFLGGGGVIAALLVNLLTSAGQLVAAWAIYRWRFWRPLGGQRLDVGDLLRRAWPFALAAVLVTLQARVGIILLERLADAGQAGHYTVAGRFVEAARMAPNAFFGALLPALAALRLQPEVFHRTFTQATLGLAGFGVLVGLAAGVFAGPLVALTYGPAFSPAVPVLQVAMWGLLPSLLRGGRTLYWYALGREGSVNRVMAALLVMQVVLGAWLIPHHGAVGAALAALIAETVALALLWWGVPWPAREAAQA